MKTKFFLTINGFVLTICLITVLALSSCKKEIQQSSVQDESNIVHLTVPEEQQSANMFVPNEILVKFKTGISSEAKLHAFARIGGNVSERILTKTMQRFNDNEGIYLIHTALPALEAISKIKGIEIEYSEPNYIYTHDAISDDPYFTNGSLWGMNGNYGCNASAAWTNGHTGSSSVVIGVIDEGAMYNHTDLVGNFWTNPFDPVNGVDDDGNGYKDDVHGWDFDGNNNTTFDGTQDDHGTHVSGTIGAIGGNGTGVAGINWNVTIISAKFLGRRGGTTANAIKAVDYITDLKTRHNLNIVTTNNSWGGGGFSQGLQDAIGRANAKDILFVAAAGNGGSDGVGDNNDAVANYPSNYPNDNVIAVAALTSSGAKSSYSNYGLTKVDLGAPGSGIYSTLPGSGNTSTYGSYSGTSMATPHVTGAVALYASTHPGSTAAQIKSAILTSTIATSSLQGMCVSGGRLNVSGF